MHRHKPDSYRGNTDVKMGSTGCSFGTDIYIKCSCGAKLQICEEYGEEELIRRWNTRVQSAI